MKFRIVSNFLKKYLKKGPVCWAFFVFIILGLGYFAFQEYTIPDEEWYACRQDNECTPNTLCDSNAINKKYVTRATLFNKLIEPFSNTVCMDRNSGDTHQAVCNKHSKCTDIKDTKPEDWIQCKSVDDCIAVDGVCRNISINGKYIFVAKDYYSKERQRYWSQCEPHARLGDFIMSCEESQCVGRYREENWYKCETADDCVAAEAVCGPLAVNKQSKAEVEQYFKELKHRIVPHCAPKPSGKFTMYCRVSSCEGEFHKP
ncbi:MAG: hypothetical protein WC635_09095 [Bacteriovorax sp.]|jgi:hypothetical protein